MYDEFITKGSQHDWPTAKWQVVFKIKIGDEIKDYCREQPPLVWREVYSQGMFEPESVLVEMTEAEVIKWAATVQGRDRAWAPDAIRSRRGLHRVFVSERGDLT